MDDSGEDYIEKALKKMHKNKMRLKKMKESINYSRLKPKSSLLNTPMMRDLKPKKDLAKTDLKDITKDTVHIDKEYVRGEMKRRLRFAWKDPGYKNDAFNPVQTLPNKVSF